MSCRANNNGEMKRSFYLRKSEPLPEDNGAVRNGLKRRQLLMRDIFFFLLHVAEDEVKLLGTDQSFAVWLKRGAVV